jgi:hypothetical protein
MSTGVETLLRGAGGTITGIAPDGVGKSTISRFPALCGRRARKVQKTIQAQSTLRRVQATIICVGGMAAGRFMGTTSFLDIHNSFSIMKDSRHKNRPASFSICYHYT